MKFGKRLKQTEISEWSSKYVRYEHLNNLISSSYPELVSEGRKLGEMEGEEGTSSTMALVSPSEVPWEGGDDPILVHPYTLPSQVEFWRVLEEDISIVSHFYTLQKGAFVGAFGTVVREMVSLGLLDEYTPFKRACRAQRELDGMRLKRRVVVDTRITPECALHLGEEGGGEVKKDGAEEISLAVHALGHEDEASWGRWMDESRSNLSLVSEDAVNGAKKHFEELHRGLQLLVDYMALNMEAFSKILKKNDKVTGLSMQSRFMDCRLGKMNFAGRNDVKDLLVEAEYVYSLAFGRVQDAPAKVMDNIRKVDTLTPARLLTPQRINIGLGFFSGISLPLIVLVFSFIGQPRAPGDDYVYKDEMVLIFRALGLPVLLVWLWGIDMYVWTKYRINYVFIFDFNWQTHSSHNKIFGWAALLTMMWLMSLFMYMAPVGVLGPLDSLSPLVWPALLSAAYVVALVRSAISNRAWLFSAIGRIVTSPFYPVSFKDFFLADQLISLAIMNSDLFFSSCFWVTGDWTRPDGAGVCLEAHRLVSPLVVSLPLLWRLLQCLRRSRDMEDRWQLVNAGKYGTGILVAIVGAWRSISTHTVGSPVASTGWFVLICISTIYSGAWDATKDWGFRSRFFLQPPHTRSPTMYPWAPRGYFVSLGVNSVLRLAWTLTLSPVENLGLPPHVFRTLLAILEVCRRAQWNVYRLENEHVNNVGNFRATKEIPGMP